MPDATCALPRPEQTLGRPLGLLQTWATPGGGSGELFLEPHADHVHLWWRWNGRWTAILDPADWAHFKACVQPILAPILASMPLLPDVADWLLTPRWGGPPLLARPSCALARPGPDRPPAPLEGIESWTAPSGARGELLLEPHGDHGHVWVRWNGQWTTPTDPDDWTHYRACIAPRSVARLTPRGLRLDALSAERLHDST